MLEKIVINGFPLDTKVEGVMLLESIAQGVTRQNTNYLSLRLSDGKESIDAKLWDMSKENFELQEESLIAVTLYAKTYNDVKSFEVKKYCNLPEDSGYNLEDFVKKAPYKPEEMYEYILKVVNQQSADSPICNICTLIYETNKEKLLYWSAAERVHHNVYGGLLYHTFRMIQTGQVLCKVYPALNKELLFCAIALHDIGKLKELETSKLGNASYTIEGSLLGHSALGILMIDRARKELGIDEECILDLIHCLASHHGELEFGAIQKPSTMEAYILHEIDMIDSRIYQYEDILKNTEPGEMSDKMFTLGNVRVYHSELYHPNE